MVIYQGFSSGDIPIAEMADFYRIGERDLPADRPYTWLMFVKSLDGRATFVEPGRATGKEVALGHLSDHPTHKGRYPDIEEGARGDQRLLQYGWVIADAIMAGAGILREEHGQEWEPWDQELLTYQRESGRPKPLRVLVTGSGSVDLRERVFRPDRNYGTIVFTGKDGERAIREQNDRLTLSYKPLDQNVTVYGVGEGTRIDDFGRVLSLLYGNHGVRLLDFQGGPDLATQLLNAGLLNEYRFTISPHIMGDHYQGRPRPSPFKGLSENPDTSPLFPHIVPVRQVGSHVYYRTRPILRR